MRKIRRNQKRQARRSRLTKRTLAAGAAAAITIAAGAAIEKTFAATPDPHQLPVKQDADGDLLADREEFAIGYDPFNPDQNRNLLLDGAELANRCADVISSLPTWAPGEPRPIPLSTYRIEHLLDGLEQCDICGQWIHMGGSEIINPKLALHYPDPNDPMNSVFLPDLAVHYMTHGSFDCAGSEHKGRVDIPRLLRTLELRFPCDPNEHQLPLDANDLDGDLLADLEELASGYDLYDPDQDDNLTPDGIDLANQCAEVIDQLPVFDPYSADAPEYLHKQNFFQKGIEECHICGMYVNMGFWKVVNPALKLEIDVPDIVCHYMTHGAFSYSGDIHGKGRIDVPALLNVLEMPRRCGHLGTLYLPGDSNKDCEEDFKDLAHFADKWLDSTDPNQPPEPVITYQVTDCDPGTYQAVPPPLPLRGNEPPPHFSASVEGQYVHFQDMVAANCCPDEIKLEMTLDDNLITVFEKEYLTSPCYCNCEFPATATLGPFDDGAYTLEVYLLNGIDDGEPSTVHFIGSINLNIGSGP